MKFAVYYNDSNPVLNTRIKEIAEMYKGEVLDSEFFKGDTTVTLSFENEGLFNHFFEDSKRLASKLSLKLAKSGFAEIDA